MSRKSGSNPNQVKLNFSKPVYRAPIIAIEGPDGAGKSTLCDQISEYLISNRSKWPNRISSTTDPKIVHVPCDKTFITNPISETISKLGLTTPHQIQAAMIENIQETYSHTFIYHKHNPTVPIILDRWIISNMVYSFIEGDEILFDMKRSLNGFGCSRETFDTLNIHDIYGCFYYLPKELYPDLVIHLCPSKSILRVRSNQRKDYGHCTENDADIDKIFRASDCYLSIFNQLSHQPGMKNKIPNTKFTSDIPDWWIDQKAKLTPEEIRYVSIKSSSRSRTADKVNREVDRMFRVAKNCVGKLLDTMVKRDTDAEEAAMVDSKKSE